MSEFSTLNEIRSILLEDGDLGRALRLSEEFFRSYPAQSPDSRLQDIRSDYGRMKDFVLRGYDDSERDALYHQLLRRLYHVVSDMRLGVLLRRNATYQSAAARASRVSFTPDSVREGLESFVQETALLSLEPNQKSKEEIYDRHQQLLTSLFDHILVSPQWSESMSRYYSQLLLSPTIDMQDAELLVSAIMLSCLNIFDIHKFHTLFHVSLGAVDEPLRQRALVGWAFCLDNAHDYTRLFPEIRKWMATYVSDEDRCTDFMELQKQVLLCIHADKDAQTIQQNIMPEIMRNQNFTVDRLGIHEKEDDPMNDILHPDASDKRMEEMERLYRQMLDMQKQGSDIYFGGFSKMKRFPFFYQLCNWFMPFSVEHPALRHMKERVRNTKILDLIFSNGPFCDSDKYSFAIAMNTVIDRIPANLVEMMNSGEMALGPSVSSQEQGQPVYVRRLYLQDLYRFFMLYQQKNDFYSPFSYDSPLPGRYFFVNKVFSNTLLGRCAARMMQFMVRHQQLSLAKDIADAYPEVGKDAEGVRMMALCREKEGLAEEAARLYERVDEMRQGDEAALRCAARLRFSLKQHELAMAEYETLCRMSPDNLSYQMGRCVVSLWTDKIGEGVNKLYELSFNYPDNLDIQRALAWGLLVQGKPRQAEAIYDRLLHGRQHEAADYLNAGYSKWFQRKVSDAVMLFRNYVADGRHDIAKALADDGDLLTACHIGAVERYIMIDIVSSSDETAV